MNADKGMGDALTNTDREFAVAALELFEKLVMNAPDTPRQTEMVQLDENGQPVTSFMDIPISLAGAVQSLQLNPLMVMRGIANDPKLKEWLASLNKMVIDATHGQIVAAAAKGDLKSAEFVVRNATQQQNRGFGITVNTVGNTLISSRDQAILGNQNANATEIDTEAIDSVEKHLLTHEELDDDPLETEIVESTPEEATTDERDSTSEL